MRYFLKNWHFFLNFVDLLGKSWKKPTGFKRIKRKILNDV